MIRESLKGKSIYDFQGQAANQLSLRAGDIITITQKGDRGGWSKGIDIHGKAYA